MNFLSRTRQWHIMCHLDYNKNFFLPLVTFLNSSNRHTLLRLYWLDWGSNDSQQSRIGGVASLVSIFVSPTLVMWFSWIREAMELLDGSIIAQQCMRYGEAVGKSCLWLIGCTNTQRVFIMQGRRQNTAY